MKKYGIKWLFAGVVAMSVAACSPDGAFDDGATPEPPVTGQGFKVSVGASSGSEAAATRAEYDGATYKWTSGDRVGFYMASAGNAPIAANVPLASTNIYPDGRFSDFEGELTPAQMPASGSGSYDYYSYFPYSAAAGTAFPDVAFTIPGTIDLKPGVFPTEYGFMVADKVTAAPVTWLEGGEQRFGGKIGFEYRHVFAYLEVYLSINLMSQPINKIVVTCKDTGAKLSGTAKIDLTDGKVSFAEGSSNTITVNIGGAGLNIRSATDYDRIWIPINPALAGKQFDVTFTSTYGNSYTTTITGGALQAGKKHKAGMKVGWVCNFSDLNPRPDSWNGDNITHKGYSFWRWRVNLGPNRKGPFGIGYSEDYNPFSGGVVYFDVDDGELETPEIKIVNSLGLTNINVKVTFTASGNAATGDKIMRYGFTKSGGGGGLTGQTTLDINSAKAYSFTGALTPATPNVKFKGNTWGYYWIYLQEIKIEPNF